MVEDVQSWSAIKRTPPATQFHLIERINSRHGTHIVDYAARIGLGSLEYELVELTEQDVAK